MHNPSAIDIDKERNYYNCGGFGHIARYCKNQRMVGQGIRISYQNNNHDLKENESLTVLN